MSIAIDEAFAYSNQVLHDGDEFGNTMLRFPFPQHENIKKAYVSGRTAEPTDAEIKAAVRAMHYRHAADWESDEDHARRLLESARKAVME